MFKKIVQRSLLGFPLGVFIGYSITVMISFFQRDGFYSPVVPSLSVSMGTELNAVLLQYFLSGVLGAGSAASSLVWEIEEWSILKRTIAHFLIITLVMFPVAYLNHWLPPGLNGLLAYALVFVVIYVVIWLVQYVFWMRKVQQINRKIRGG